MRSSSFRLTLLIALLGLLPQLSNSGLQARSFTVAVYNLENFFDADGVAAYDEYQGKRYTPVHFNTKLQNTARVIARLGDDGKGPDILLCQEVEVDQTPAEGKADYAALLRTHADKTVEQLLTGALPTDAADWPAEAWLLKKLNEQGLTGYTVVAGEDSATSPYEDGHKRAIKNVIFTRFPVKAVRNYPLANARNIIELQLEVDGKPLYVFSNHWKSGASDPGTELLRVANAKVLRARLDEILAADPHADIILGGDFNSQYNQKQRYPQMKVTGLNDILGSQGDEMALRGPKADLFNLWFDLPPQERTSDVFRGEWGTLMQIIISRGLFDYNGIQFVEGSMQVGKFAGLNQNADGTPVRWSSSGSAGSGFSDHFPIFARFQTVEEGSRDHWLELRHPADGSAPSEPLHVSMPKPDKLPEFITPPEKADLRDGSFNGKIMLVKGRVAEGRRLAVEFRSEKYEVYAPDPELGKKLRDAWGPDTEVRFYGELGQYRGRWQFIIRDAAWILPSK